jgi:molecular chaperone DnaK (HSP70)
VCFFDMGDTQTQCAVMRYSKGKLEVLGYAYDHHLGGRNFTAAIAEHFRQEWIGKYKIDVATNARAMLRTTEACQNLKHTLSANAHGNVNLDCLVNDKDVSGKLEREKFVEMVKPLLEQILLPVQRALDMAGVKKEDIGSIEVVGDSHRIPAISEKLNSFFGKQPSKRTNATEVVAKGAAWQCARRSPVFKVVPYELKVQSGLFIVVFVLTISFVRTCSAIPSTFRGRGQSRREQRTACSRWCLRLSRRCRCSSRLRSRRPSRRA